MSKGLKFYWKYLRWLMHYHRPEHDVKIETANGVLTVSSKDWLIGKHLFTRCEYEIDFIKNSIDLLEHEQLLARSKKRTVVDIGANVGMICIALLRENLFENAIAFEPGPRNFKLLRENVEINSLADRVRCYPLALSSENGQVVFEIEAENSGDSRVRKTTAAGKMREENRMTVSVKATKFDTFLLENKVDQNEIDLLWIDIQGHEGHFFKGSQNFFRKRKIPVISEFWGYGIGRSGMSKTEYCDIVTGTFSKFYYLTEAGFQPKLISEIDLLFAKYSKPREIANIILI